MTRVIETLSTHQIVDALRRDENAGWSYEGAKALADYMENLAEDLGEPIELDVVAWRCDFSEYETLGMIADEYDDMPQADDYDDPDEWEEAALSWLQDRTTVLDFEGGYIIQAF